MRKSGILLSLLTTLLCFPLSSFALGLGEIEVNSYLNQPLKADIEVVSARPGEIDDLLVSLASRDAFRKAGLERPADLSKLRFKIEKSEDGQSARILVSTKTAVKEPFLNFLIEADWAKGRLLREYTVLLDPPFFAQQPEPAAAAVTQEPAPVAESQASTTAPTQQNFNQPEETPPAFAQPEPIALSQQPAASEPEQETESPIPYVADTTYTDSAPVDGEIVVTKGDTLWAIASQFKDADHSMAQVMLAIQAANPDAFSQDNINNLKVGAVLRAPDSDAYDALSKQEAYAQVLEQNGLWDDYVARKTGVATAGSPMVSDADTQQDAETDPSQLSLLAAGDDESTTASMNNDAAEDAGQIRKQLALAEEELEAANLENQDLRSRVSDLEAQIMKFEELQKLVQIEDSSLAQLQQQSEQQDEETPVVSEEMTDEMVEDQPSDVMIQAADEMMAESSEEDAMPEDTTEMTTDMMDSSEDTMAESDDTMQSTEAETVMDTVPEQDMMSDSTAEGMVVEEETTPPTATVPAPVIVTEPASDGGIMDMLPSMDNLLADPIMLGGIGAIVLLLLGLLFVKRRKSSEDEGITLEEPDDLITDDDATPIHVPTTDEVEGQAATEEDMVDTAKMELETQVDEVDQDEFAQTAVISADEISLDELEEEPAPAAEEEQDDVLNEVDVYLAYGLYENAEELLKESLENTPDRADYRAKLLDTYFATKNKDLFVQEAEALKSLGGASDRYWDRVQIMGFELAPDNEMFAGAQDSDMSVADLEFAKPESADFDIGADDDLTDYSNTDFDLSGDTVTFDEVLPADDADDGVFPDTQTMAPAGDDFSATQTLDDEETQLPELDEPVAAEPEDLPDEIGDFDLDLGSDELDKSDDDIDNLLDEDEVNIDDDALSFDLPEDLDLSTDIEDVKTDDDIIELDDTIEAPDMDQPPVMSEDDIELDLGDDVEFEPETSVALDDRTDEISIDDIPDLETDDVGQTQVMDAVDVEDKVEEIDEQGTRHVEAALDLDMSDIEGAELQTGSFEPTDTASEEVDDITEFRPADMTGEFEVPIDIDSEQEPEIELESDLAVEDVDAVAGLEKTGTFAPGDFSDEELDAATSVEGMDDIEDLMLPDDVDEVGTKLDLAKAFIDMGDAEGAKSSLEEVLAEGTQEQKAEATGLLDQIK